MLPEVLTDISLDNSALDVIETPKFDAEQLKAVSLRTGKNLVTGLPGTGKTLVLAENVIQQINSGIASDKILIFCFSRDQVRTMRKYLSRRLFEKSIPQVSTFHSFTHAVMQSALNQGILSENYSLSPLRLLSGPEQEVIISELIKGSIEDNSIDWPQYLKPSLQTRGFVRQVRNLLARMRSLGMDPDQLIEVGQKYENNNWIALGHFAEMYLDNLDASESIDYGELIHRVNLLLHQVKDLKELNINYSHFYVDEYQDIDSSQVRLLKKLVSPNKFLFCAGDKSESIYQFRGADIKALDRFNEDFGSNEQINLKYNYRTKVKIEPELLTFDSFNSQSNYIANEVSKFKYENISNKWSDVLIIIRNSNSLKNIQRSLSTFGIPVEVDAEDLPLIKEPAARVLIDCLTIAGELALGKNNPVNPTIIKDLLKGPLIQASTFELREAARLIRKKIKELDKPQISSDQALYLAVLNHENLYDLPIDITKSIRTLGALLHTAKELIVEKKRVEVVLWSIWNYEINQKYKELYKVQEFKDKWSKNLQKEALLFGVEGRIADQDLDAILSLFDLASREDERTLGTRGVLNFINDLGKQNFQAETIEQKSLVDAKVKIVTAHKVKGLEAKFVIIPDLQTDIWPSIKLRNTLLEVERLDYENVVRPPSKKEILEEEKRLFEVAKSRANQKILISAVKNDYENHAEPSSFLNNFFDEKPKHIIGFLQKNLSLNSIVTNLRRLAENENGQTEFKKALAQRLYKINQTKDIFNRPVSANSNPHNWWATFSSNDDFYEIIKEKTFIKLSASSLATLRDCSLKWFLERKAGATLLRQNSASIGSIIHAIAQGLTNEEIDPNLESLKKELDKVWYQLNFESEWLNKREYENTLEILQNLLSWHLKRNDKKVLGAEVYFNFEIYFEEIDATAQVSGFIDRLEADIDEISNIHIIDFKTSKNNLTKNEAGQDPQLGIYRLAVQKKSIKLELAENAIDKSADLVYLRLQNKSGVIERESYDVEQSNIKETIKNALLVIKDQNYKATPNPMCRTCSFKRMCPAQPEGRGVIE